MRVQVARIQYLFDVAVLVFSTGAFTWKMFNFSKIEDLNAGNGASQAIWICIYLISSVHIIQKRYEIVSFFRNNVAFALFIMLVMMSIIWSGNPFITFRRGFALLLTTVFAVQFAIRNPLQRQILMLERVFTVILVGSIVSQTVFPGLFPPQDLSDQAETAVGWNGVFPSKNMCGHMLALGLVVFLLSKVHTRRQAITRVCLCVASVVMIIKSQSGTSLVSAIILSFSIWKIFPYIKRNYSRRLSILPVAFVGSLLVIIAVMNYEVVCDLLGRDSTLTGRTILWEFSIKSAAKRPMLGYGYDAFWNISVESYRIRDYIGWLAPHAHNGLIDLSLNLGCVGIVAFLCAYAASIRRAVWFMCQENEIEGMLPLAYFVMAGIFIITETIPLAANSLYCILFITSTYYACSFQYCAADETVSLQQIARTAVVS